MSLLSAVNLSGVRIISQWPSYVFSRRPVGKQSVYNQSELPSGQNRTLSNFYPSAAESGMLIRKAFTGVSESV